MSVYWEFGREGGVLRCDWILKKQAEHQGQFFSKNKEDKMVNR